MALVLTSRGPDYDGRDSNLWKDGGHQDSLDPGDDFDLEKGILAENYQLVERAKTIIENMGARVMGPAALREKLGLIKRTPRG